MAYCLASQATSLYFTAYNVVPVERRMKAVKISSEKLIRFVVSPPMDPPLSLNFWTHAGT